MSYKNNNQLYQEAKEAMDGQWGIAAGGTFIISLLSGVASNIPGIGELIAILIGGPIALGYAIFIIALSKRNDPQIEQLFKGFSDFVRSLSTYFVMAILILLWSLLLIIPGIMKAYSYTMTFYILAEDSEIQTMDALKKSEEMMYGNRMRLFWLQMKFIGWLILALFTLGIGYFWLAPFMSTAQYKFYQDLKGEEEEFDSLSDHLLEDY